ncbi:hypothetical protein EUX98_g4945 [Antrodiella citrinella]|uniref:RING-type E3 ubiquitin transferase n=1 Tax=Antrodiella citrinella TaxID=2447956 RepID=A0A4S4MVJ4_9APHY|nr:hypothetical protein EUX98_g4945 [Antrodiella citrinella]
MEAPPDALAAGPSTSVTIRAAKDIAFGSVAGMTAKVFEHPFDLTKVRLQSQVLDATARFSGPIDCLKQTWKKEGIRGLYRGLPAPIVGAMTENAALFLSYNELQNALRWVGGIPLSRELSLGQLAVAAAGAGAITSFFLTPIELVKCKMQVQMLMTPALALGTTTAGPVAATFTSPSSFQKLPGPISVLTSVVRTTGFRGLWLGHIGTLIRETGGGAAWFCSKEAVARLLLARRHASAKHGEPKPELKVWESAVSGACAGVSYNLALFPADTVKSAMQTEAELRPRAAGEPDHKISTSRPFAHIASNPPQMSIAAEHRRFNGPHASSMGHFPPPPYERDPRTLVPYNSIAPAGQTCVTNAQWNTYSAPPRPQVQFGQNAPVESPAQQHNVTHYHPTPPTYFHYPQPTHVIPGQFESAPMARNQFPQFKGENNGVMAPNYPHPSAQELGPANAEALVEVRYEMPVSLNRDSYAFHSHNVLTPPSALPQTSRTLDGNAPIHTSTLSTLSPFPQQIRKTSPAIQHSSPAPLSSVSVDAQLAFLQTVAQQESPPTLRYSPATGIESIENPQPYVVDDPSSVAVAPVSTPQIDDLVVGPPAPISGSIAQGNTILAPPACSTVEATVATAEEVPTSIPASCVALPHLPTTETLVPPSPPVEAATVSSSDCETQAMAKKAEPAPIVMYQITPVEPVPSVVVPPSATIPAVIAPSAVTPVTAPSPTSTPATVPATVPSPVTSPGKASSKGAGTVQSKAEKKVDLTAKAQSATATASVSTVKTPSTNKGKTQPKVEKRVEVISQVQPQKAPSVAKTDVTASLPSVAKVSPTDKGKAGKKTPPQKGSPVSKADVLPPVASAAKASGKAQVSTGKSVGAEAKAVAKRDTPSPSTTKAPGKARSDTGKSLPAKVQSQKSIPVAKADVSLAPTPAETTTVTSSGGKDAISPTIKASKAAPQTLIKDDSSEAPETKGKTQSKAKKVEPTARTPTPTTPSVSSATAPSPAPTKASSDKGKSQSKAAKKTPDVKAPQTTDIAIKAVASSPSAIPKASSSDKGKARSKDGKDLDATVKVVVKVDVSSSPATAKVSGEGKKQTKAANITEGASKVSPQKVSTVDKVIAPAEVKASVPVQPPARGSTSPKVKDQTEMSRGSSATQCDSKTSGSEVGEPIVSNYKPDSLVPGRPGTSTTAMPPKKRDLTEEQLDRICRNHLHGFCFHGDFCHRKHVPRRLWYEYYDREALCPDGIEKCHLKRCRFKRFQDDLSHDASAEEAKENHTTTEVQLQSSETSSTTSLYSAETSNVERLPTEDASGLNDSRTKSRPRKKLMKTTSEESVVSASTSGKSSPVPPEGPTRRSDDTTTGSDNQGSDEQMRKDSGKKRMTDRPFFVFTTQTKSHSDLDRLVDKLHNSAVRSSSVDLGKLDTIIPSVPPGLGLEPQASSTSPQQQPRPVTVTVIDAIRVTFGPGFEVQLLQTGFESRQITMKGIPATVTVDAVKKVLLQFGEVTVQIPDQKADKTMRVKANFTNHVDAGSAVAALDGSDVLGGRMDVQLVSTSPGKAIVQDGDVCLEFPSPSKIAYAGYTNHEQANAAIALAFEAAMYGEIYEGLPNLGPVNVRFQGLDPNAQCSDVEKFGEPEGVMLGDYNYRRLETALEKLYDKLESFGDLETLDVLPPPYPRGIVRAWAHFGNPRTAERVCEEMHFRTQRFIGFTRLSAHLQRTSLYSLPANVFDALMFDIRYLRYCATMNQQRCNVIIMDRRRLGIPLVKVKLVAEDLTVLGRLKHSFELLLKGDLVVQDGSAVWDPFFTSWGGLAFLNELQGTRGVLINRDVLRRRLSLFGPVGWRVKTRRAIMQKVEEMRSRPYKVFSLVGRVVGLFMSADLAKLQEELGAENIKINLKNKTLTVHGNEDAFAVARLAISSAQRRHPSERKLVERACPVCLDEVTSPVSLECGHAWCRSCLSDYIMASVDTRVFPLTCLGDEARCTQRISLDVAKGVLSSSQVASIFHSSFLAYVHAHASEFHHCPTPDCDQIYRKAAKGTILRCPSCLVRICTDCDKEHHEGTCRYSESEDMKMFEEWTKDHDVKKCPVCKAPIERSAGCNHMTCTRCKTHICWVCVATFTDGDEVYDHMHATHGGIGL